MYVIAAFEQTISVELAIASLLEAGIAQSEIMAVPLQRAQEPRLLFDSIHHADGISTLDLSAVLGTCFMLLGAIYGFEFAWGPIVWGIIGAISGILLGLIVKIGFAKRRIRRESQATEVILIVRAKAMPVRQIEEILWQHQALGLSSVRASSP